MRALFWNAASVARTVGRSTTPYPQQIKAAQVTSGVSCKVGSRGGGEGWRQGAEEKVVLARTSPRVVICRLARGYGGARIEKDDALLSGPSCGGGWGVYNRTHPRSSANGLHLPVFSSSPRPATLRWQRTSWYFHCLKIHPGVYLAGITDICRCWHVPRHIDARRHEKILAQWRTWLASPLKMSGTSIFSKFGTIFFYSSIFTSWSHM